MNAAEERAEEWNAVRPAIAFFLESDNAWYAERMSAPSVAPPGLGTVMGSGAGRETRMDSRSGPSAPSDRGITFQNDLGHHAIARVLDGWAASAARRVRRDPRRTPDSVSQRRFTTQRQGSVTPIRPTTNRSFLEVLNVTKQYGSTTVLDSVTFNVTRGRSSHNRVEWCWQDHVV